MRDRVHIFIPDPQYMTRQSDITAQMCAVLIGWLPSEVMSLVTPTIDNDKDDDDHVADVGGLC